MSTATMTGAREAAKDAGGTPVVNDFSIQVATVNGSGSQTANMVLMRSIFRMGVPVSGKNLFPSNIAGLPTWFTIRANKDGYIARKRDIDIVIPMNAETAKEDVMSVRAGAAVICPDKLGLDQLRDDVIFYPVPFDRLIVECCPEVKLRKLVTNMLYVGVIAQLLEVDTEEIRNALGKQLKGKQKAIGLNWAAIEKGMEYAKTNLPKRDPFRVERMAPLEGKFMIEGNAASALGCIFAGCTVVTWYPITPSTSLVESFIEYSKEFRIEKETGKSTVAVLQAEDELAAIGMVLGAGWAGARSMTSTSGPGISLMAEFIGLGYYAEVPGVIFDVSRTGPSTGLPTRTMQGDLNQLYYLSHGDTKHIVLLPDGPEEAFLLAQKAFDLSERFQTPVFVMTDLDLGMNYWMCDRLPYPEGPVDRGKVLSASDLDRLKGDWGRYRDVDGDGITYRTLPGTKHLSASYFTRGSGHNANAVYSERPDDYVKNVDRLVKKFETARKHVPPPVIDDRASRKNAKAVGIVAFGTSHWGVVEARDKMARQFDLDTDYLRLLALPLSPEVGEWISRHDRIYVVEQNRDGQLASILRSEFPEFATRFRSVLQYNGLPLDATTVIEGVLSQEGK